MAHLWDIQWPILSRGSQHLACRQKLARGSKTSGARPEAGTIQIFSFQESSK